MLLTTLVCASWPAAGQPGRQAGPRTPAAAGAPPVIGKIIRPNRDVRVSKLFGMSVHGTQGEQLGEIRDLIVDVPHNKVPYALLAFAGVLGINSKLFPVPLQAFELTPAGDELTLSTDKDKLRGAPGFDPSHWPDLAQGDYIAQVDRYFGMAGSATAATGRHVLPASKLIGKDIADLQGKGAGQVHELVLTLGSNTVHYAVIEFEKAWVPDDKLLALPLYALAQPEDPDRDLVLTVQRDRLDMAHGFDDTQWPDLNDPIFQRDTNRYLRNLPPPLAAPNGRP